ncbi:MAG: hypothetical protein LBH14_04210 [Desulfobulbaceae bacterium]|jgi:hypothetical protein|nr:hypothetical protein [Desulfobulbaceae bacterium]
MAGIVHRKKKARRWLWWLLAVLLCGLLAYIPHRPVIAWVSAVYRAARQSPDQEEQRRGTIYDRNFAELAVSRQMVSVQSRAREIVSFEETAARLSLVIEQSREELLKKMKEASRAILATGISREQEEQITAMAMPGISIVRAPVRSYPQEVVAGHLIGYAENGVGLSGAEYAYDRVPLRFAGLLRKAGIPPGRLPDVMLTLDLKIQELMETLVKTISGSDRRTQVGAYVLDLAQGEMLAAAQWPPMNPNMYRQYEPGDLNSIIIQTVPLPEKFRRFFRDVAMLQSNFEKGKNILPWSVGANNSSSRGEIQLWNKLRFSDMALPDFANQELADRGEENYYYCPSLAGHDYGSAPESLSPLQFLTGIGILARGGSALQPFAVAAALDPDNRDNGKPVLVDLSDSREPQEAVPEVVAKEAMQIFSAMAAPGAADKPILYDQVDCQVSGKNAGLMRHQLYAAVVPAQNPQYLLVVSVRKATTDIPTQNERGKTDDLAEVNALLERVLMFVEVGRGLRGYAASRTDSSGAYSTKRDLLRQKIRADGSQKEEALAAPKQWLMPDMASMSLRRGLRLLNGAPCRLEITGSGDVLRQSPAAGAVIKDGTVCQLILRNPAEITIDKIKARNEAAASEVPKKTDKNSSSGKTKEKVKAKAGTPP